MTGPTPGRICGTCTLCCKTMGIVELAKPVNVWCHHCDIGKGCRIYGEHPQSCRDFACLWLQGVGPDEMQPSRSKVVLFLPESNSHILGVSVDPSSPDAWQHGAVGRVIQNWLKNAKNAAVIMHGDQAQVHGTDPAVVADVSGRVQLYRPKTT